MTVRDERLAPWPRTEQEVRKHLHEYYATITALDGHIGRILQTLHNTGQYDNTIVIVSSDHGLSIGSHGLFGKQNLYEHAMKAPLIFAGPGIPKGESDALVYLMDIFPTVCELTGAKTPKGIDGRSLASVVAGHRQSVRETLGTSYRDVMRSVRDAQWKLIRYPHIDRTQLFDLQADPHELVDLASNPMHAPHVRRLMDMLTAWQKEVGDTALLTVANPKDGKFDPTTVEAVR